MQPIRKGFNGVNMDIKAQDVQVSLEQALASCKRPFAKKLIHSVELLRKAEKLALTYDQEGGFFLAFSGGKDSQALFHVAKMAGVKFKAHMNLTSVDPPQVIRFVKKQYPDVVRHAPQKSIFQLAVERGILPSMRIRWCCADLKETAGAGKVTLIGIRKAESVRRSKRHEVEVSNRQFSGNLDEFGQWQKEQIEKKEAKLIRKMKREGKKVNEDEFSLEKDNEVRCINGKDSILISPIFDWAEHDVWYFLNEVVKVPHCELYDQGYKRIGCILCPMSAPSQKVREMKQFPHVKRNWIKTIKAIRAGGGITKQTYVQGAGNSPEWERKVLQLRDGKCTEFHKGTIQQFEHIKQLPPPPTISSTANGVTEAHSATGCGNTTTGRVARKYLWNRKTNSGIWAGFRIAPL